MHRFARRTLFAVCLTAGITAPPAALGQAPTGNMNLHLGVPVGYELEVTSVLIRNTAIGYMGTVNFGGGSGPFSVIGLPAGNGYIVTVTSTPVGGGACSGINPDFPIFENTTTTVYASLACERSGSGQGPNGNLNLHLGVPASWTLNETSVHIQNTSIGYSGTVIFGGGSGPLSVTNLPAANGYTATIASTAGVSAIGAVGTCSGSAPSFPIFADATTINYMRIDCARPPGVPALGAYVPLLAVGLGLVGSLAVRRRRRAQ